MQSANAEHVNTTAAVASMVLPVIVTVKDIAAGSTARAVDTDVPLNFPTRDWNCQVHAHTHATLRRQAQHIDGV